MTKNKYKVVFDANILYCDEENCLNKVFNSNIGDVFNFLKSNKVTDLCLCAPQLVIDERISHRLLMIESQYESFNRVLRNLKVFGHINVKEKNFNRNKYKKILNKNVSLIIKKYKIKIIPTAKIEQELIIKRALDKVAPFYGQGKGDRGFKDTLIWLSLLKDAKNNKKYNYILVTDDKTGFTPEVCENEFKKYSTSTFLIKRSISDLKEFVDEKFNLELEYKKLYQEIEQEVLALKGTITTKVGGFLNSERARPDYLTPVLSVHSYVSGNKDNNNFDFYSLEINNISQVDNNGFNIDANLKVINRDSNDQQNLWGYNIAPVYVHSRNEDKIMKYKISIEYNRNMNSIDIISVAKDSLYSPYLENEYIK